MVAERGAVEEDEGFRQPRRHRHAPLPCQLPRNTREVWCDMGMCGTGASAGLRVKGDRECTQKKKAWGLRIYKVDNNVVVVTWDAEAR